jgi:hypothetical protein
MKTHKEGAELSQISHVSEIVERVWAHISRPEVAGFTIGYSSGKPDKRVRGSDHRDHARTEEPIILAGGLTRRQALDLEAQITARLMHHPNTTKEVFAIPAAQVAGHKCRRIPRSTSSISLGRA